MQLSVIILNYNVRYFLEQCVLSVQQALEGIDGEIIVVDNNSPDDSCAMMRQRFPEVKLIENSENSGFPKGNNIGVAKANGKYICILNPDTVVAGDTFRKALAFADDKPDLGIIGVKLVDGTGHFLRESKRGVPTPWVAFTKVAGLYRFFPKWQVFTRYYAEHLPEDQAGKTDILPGAFMLMERSLYLDAGGFDEGCFMYSDDIDLSYTVLMKGRANYYLPVPILHYKGESTIKDGLYMKRFREAMQFFYKKHFRASVAFDLFMRAGAVFFAFVKKNRKSGRKIPEEYILFSKNKNLASLLEDRLRKKIWLFEEYEKNILVSKAFSSTKQYEVILDNDAVSFGKIIDILQTHKKGGFTFKVKPSGSDFLVGSNSSDDRGEIILIKEE